MKNKILSVLLFTTILICACLPACARNQSNSPSNVPNNNSYETIIRELEEKILEIQQSQYLSETESQKKIGELQAKIDELRAEATNASTNTTTVTDNTTSTVESGKSVFIYSLSNGKAVINGYTGTEEHMVIPSSIDGFEVYSIASNAFEGYTFKSVIISEGIEYIDWFAFYGCSRLQSITIPSSVKRIGYSAFDGASKNFTIFCQSGSFAQSYAQSYGIPHAII